jgi:hypothetical protein
MIGAGPTSLVSNSVSWATIAGVNRSPELRCSLLGIPGRYPDRIHSVSLGRGVESHSQHIRILPKKSLRGLIEDFPGVRIRSLQAWLGHKNIQHTVRYTELSPTRFKNFWRE